VLHADTKVVRWIIAPDTRKNVVMETYGY